MNHYLSVGNHRVEWASYAVSEAFFSTISYRLEPNGKGTRFPKIIGELWSGKLESNSIEQAISEWQMITKELASLPIDQIVSNLDKLSKFNERDGVVNQNAQDLQNYFIVPSKKTMVQVLEEMLILAQLERKAVQYRTKETISGRGIAVGISLFVFGLISMVGSYFDAKYPSEPDEILVVLGPLLMTLVVFGIFDPGLLNRPWGFWKKRHFRSGLLSMLIGISLGIAYLYYLKQHVSSW